MVETEVIILKYVNPGPMLENRASEIKLNNCGYFKDVETPVRTHRPENSRNDHHIVFVIHGSVQVEIEGCSRIAHDGDMIYFAPLALQEYTYFPGAGSSYYWLHFEGKTASEFAEKLSLTTGIYHTGNNSELASIIDKMLAYPPTPKDSYHWAVNGYLEIIFSMLFREISTPKKISAVTEKVLRMIISIQRNPEEILTNKEYAAQCAISEYHFIRLFRLQTGTTPRQFRNQVLLEKARQLLTDTDLNIGEIAQSLKFDDPLYFSRLFKKHFGRSPRQYRDMH